MASEARPLPARPPQADPGTESFTGEQAALIFRRAAELDRDRSPGVVPERLDLAALEQIAAEAGLSPAAVRQAVLELHTGALGPPPARPPRAVLGPATVVAQRTLPVPASEVGPAVDAFLEAELFRVARRPPGRTVWEPKPGVTADLRRQLDRRLRQSLSLAGVDAVTVGLAGDGHGPRPAAHVRIEARLARRRAAARSRMMAGSAAGAGVAGGGVALAVAAEAGLALVALPVGGIVAAVAIARAGARYRRTVEKVSNGLECLLDDVERGP